MTQSASVADNPLKDIRIGTLVPDQPGIAEYIKALLPHGFESFSLTFGSGKEGIDPVRTAELVTGAIADHDVVISSLGIYGNPLEDDAEAALCRKGWEQLIDNAHLFGTDIVAGFTGRLRDRPIDESLPRYREVFGDLAARAREKGVRLAFENCSMGGNWQRGDWNIAHNPAAWELMFDVLPDENIGLQWEPCHQMITLIDPMPQLRRWNERIFHVHGKDATIHKDVLREYGFTGNRAFAHHRTPGFGDSNWTEIISELRRHGFRGSIDIEGWHDPVYCGELEMTGQVYALNYLKRCRGGEYAANPQV